MASSEALDLIHLEVICQGFSTSGHTAQSQRYANVESHESLNPKVELPTNFNVREDLLGHEGPMDRNYDCICASTAIDDNLCEHSAARPNVQELCGQAECVPSQGNDTNSHDDRNCSPDPRKIMLADLKLLENQRNLEDRLLEGQAPLSCFGCGGSDHSPEACQRELMMPPKISDSMKHKLQESMRTDTKDIKLELGELEHDRHGALSWTACNDDSCLLHYDAKMESEWLLSKSSTPSYHRISSRS